MLPVGYFEEETNGVVYPYLNDAHYPHKTIEFRVTSAWRVYKKKVVLPDSELGYTIDHSAFIYLMDKNGEYYTHFSHNTEPEEILKELNKFL